MNKLHTPKMYFEINNEIDEIDINNNNNQFSIDEERLNFPIFRYKFSEELTEILSYFAKLHQHDDRHTFKEAWQVWTDENQEMILEEINRLKMNDYSGDILDKMYKSARYYYRKKSPVKPEPKKRRPYISIDDSLLKLMDAHILENIHREGYQPKTGFLLFCEANLHILKETIQTIFSKGITDIQIIQHKIKKTYKNRYFMLKP